MSEKILSASFDFILESVILIRKWFEEIQQPDDYINSLRGKSHFDATLMRLQSIGETLKKVEKTAPQLLLKYPEVNWNEIIRLREIISHHYEQLNHEIIYYTCKNDLPVLQQAVEEIIAGFKSSK
jgi:uncharacterized protein with HEPN domain